MGKQALSSIQQRGFIFSTPPKFVPVILFPYHLVELWHWGNHICRLCCVPSPLDSRLGIYTSFEAFISRSRMSPQHATNEPLIAILANATNEPLVAFLAINLFISIHVFLVFSNTHLRHRNPWICVLLFVLHIFFTASFFTSIVHRLDGSSYLPPLNGVAPNMRHWNARPYRHEQCISEQSWF